MMRILTGLTAVHPRFRWLCMRDRKSFSHRQMPTLHKVFWQWRGGKGIRINTVGGPVAVNHSRWMFWILVQAEWFLWVVFNMSSSTNLSGEKEYESTLDISDSRPISTTSIKNKEQSVIVTAIPLGSNNNDLLEPSVENPVRDDTDIPFSVFTVNQRKMMVLTGSLAAIFSPISSSIYYPSLSSIAKDLHVSDAQISLTITLFLVCIWTSKVKG